MIKRYYLARVKAINADGATGDAFNIFNQKSLFINPLKAMEYVIKDYNREYGEGNWVLLEFKRIK